MAAAEGTYTLFFYVYEVVFRIKVNLAKKKKTR